MHGHGPDGRLVVRVILTRADLLPLLRRAAGVHEKPPAAFLERLSCTLHPLPAPLVTSSRGLVKLFTCPRDPNHSTAKLRPETKVRLKADPTKALFLAYFGLKGCLAVFDPEITSCSDGFLASARWIDSLVA